jgi:hypothetical protein
VGPYSYSLDDSLDLDKNIIGLGRHAISPKVNTFLCIGENYNKKISNLISKIARKKSEMYGKHKPKRM